MSFNYNHCTLVGRLTKDPDINKESQTVRTKFRVAANRSYRQEGGVSEADFVPIVLWGRLAELAYKYLKKGMPVLIEGRIHINKFGEGDDIRWFTEISCHNFQLLGSLMEKSEIVADHSGDNIIEDEDIPDLLESAPE